MTQLWVAAGALAALAPLLTSFPVRAQEKKDPKAVPKAVSFVRQILPILKDRCDACHFPKDKKGKLDVTTYEALRKGGKTANLIVPGDPDKSFLVKEIVGTDPPMPKNANPLKPEQIDLIVRWIKEGARNN